MVNRVVFYGIVMTILMQGCGGGGRGIDPGFGAVPVSHYAMNLSVDDLLGPDGGSRATTYLDEITHAGYKPWIRMPLEEGWTRPNARGPGLLATVIPAVRQRGFKLLAILSPGIHSSNVSDPIWLQQVIERDKAWFREVLPQVRDVLIGIQFANEQWNTKIGTNVLPVFPPSAYSQWHNALSPLVRQLAPGIPIVEGDVSGDESLRWWLDVLRQGQLDYDVLSLHPYFDKQPELEDYLVAVRSSVPRKKLWITETDLPQTFSIAQTYGVEEVFLFTWASTDHFAKRQQGGTLP